MLTLVAHSIRIIRANVSPFDESYYAETDSLFLALSARADSLGMVDTVWTGSKFTFGEAFKAPLGTEEKTLSAINSSPSTLAAEIEMWVYNDTLEKPTVSFPININTASEKDLQALPRIGPQMALRIVEYRKKSAFVTIEDLMKIKGIGTKTFEKLAPLVVTETPEMELDERPDSSSIRSQN